MHHFVALFSLLVAASSWTTRSLAVNVLVAGPNNANQISLRAMNLTANQCLNTSNFYLVMQPDCNLVTYNGSVPFLTTDSSPQGPPSKWICYATMQADGNFVLYQTNATAETATQISVTYTYMYKNISTYRYLILGRDGSLSMYEPDGTSKIFIPPFVPLNASLAGTPSPAPASSPNATSNLVYPFSPKLEWKPSISLNGYPYMPAEYFLAQGSKLQTLDGRYVLMLGRDCKLQGQEILTVNNTVKRVIWDPQ